MSSIAAAQPPVNSRGRVIVASLVGTSIEFYDFYVYATAAVLVFPALFFPNDSPAAAQLSSFVTFGLAFLARPVGSVLFGHFGDRVGRKATLVASLLVMGIATFLIGVLPTFSAIGIAAPALLAVLRFTQGIGLGGEWSGAALLATENAPRSKRAIYGTFPQLGAPIGFILANTLFLVLSLTMSDAAFAAWGWRVPFLLSAVLVIVGLYVRLRLVETPAFTRTLETGTRARVPLGRVFRSSWRNVILGTFIMVATYVLFYFMTTFTLTYGTAKGSVAAGQAAAEAAGKPFNPATFQIGLGYLRNDFLVMLIIGVVFFGVFTPVAGLLADRFGRRPMLLVTTALIALFGLSFEVWFGGSAGAPVVTTAFLAVGLALMGLTFGPMGALLPELFPTNVRYTGSAIAYNVASILGASIAPIVAVLLWQRDGDITLVGLYLTGAAVITFVALLLSRETRDVDLLEASVAEAPAAP
ncbi:MFS transporter [Amnibacterium setariae]|uniref:Putative proline/betaine transporter n=1 Tax=Amnibacterium setariae TaxID=2306585 RepID=A0A3A1TTC4_9MICO|nr:MFS transporter [Amnibacterium setariae]RIX26532.1 MFS transporter [Amnibacterium setariae]